MCGVDEILIYRGKTSRHENAPKYNIVKYIKRKKIEEIEQKMMCIIKCEDNFFMKANA